MSHPKVNPSQKPSHPSGLLCVALIALLVFCLPHPATAAPPIRVALVGLVHGHAQGFLRSLPGNDVATLVAIVEPRRDLAQAYAAKFHLDAKLFYADIEKMLVEQRPDAVLVYTSIADHRKVIEAAARHAVSSMVEKPLATTLEDALAIRAIAREQHVQVLVNYETTWYSSNQEVFAEAAAGKLGELRKIVVHDGHEGPKEINVEPEFLAWLTDPRLNGGGALFDFGCYGADLMTWLMHGERPLTVTAVTQQIKPEIYSRVDDEATIILTYPKAQAIVQASWNWPFGRKDMEVYGQTGYAITVAGNDLRVRSSGSSNEQQLAARPVPAPYDNSLSYLRAVVVDGAKEDGFSSLETNVTVTEILDAARRSAATGATVRLPSSR